MEWNELEANSSVVKFGRQIKTSECVLGGILRRGHWAWLVDDSTLQIVALKSGQIISSYTFSRSLYNCNVIVCVEEVIPNNNSHDILLAVSLDYIQNSVETQVTRSSIAIYSVEHGGVLSCIRLEPYVTCMRFLSPKNCRRSFFQHFDGCLAAGTQEGPIFMIDLYLNYLLELYGERQRQCLTTDVILTDCRIVYMKLPLVEIQHTYKSILRERSLQSFEHFGIQLEAIDSPCRVETFLPIDLISGLAAGFEDGRLFIYDLWDMRIYYASEDHEQSPLIKMDFLEPPDDPRPCFYILTLHGNGEKVVTCLFAFMYEKRVTDDCDIFFENFRYGAMKMDMILESDTSMAITCQAITKPAKSVDDDATCLFAISWNSVSKEQIKLLVFDINQWYKEEMPRALSGDQAKSCLATFKLNNYKHGLDALLNPATISHFNSMQRCEEHFYPNSLSFDWMLLDINCCRVYNWPGIQNKILNVLRLSTASLFLEPDVMFEKIRQARLMPQFTELHFNALFSQNAKYDVLLSVALEHNCMGLLRDCARSWADGSFAGNNYILSTSSGVELNLQTLKNWIWKRASDIKMRCNELCEELLNCSGHPLDQREKKELGFITRQLRNLAELYDEVMHQYSKHHGEKAKDGSLHLAADYQELLIWVINIGLLPETSSRRFGSDDIPTTSNFASNTLSIYPYKQLRDYYVQRRLAFAEIDKSYISKKSGSCRLIFIDAFIEHECMRHASNDNIRENWLQNNGNGLYPPANIESMLRIMLLSNVDYESKCAILLYFFLDLHVALTDGDRHDGEDLKDIVQNFLKFPSVFKLSPSLIKTLQAFWHLDHGNIVAAVDEFLSPFNNNRKLEQWLIELLVESLLLQNAAHLALRILDAHSSLIAPSLKLSTLLANNLIAEAFHFVRSKDDIELMRRFFTNCLRMGKLGVIRDLALNEYEGKLVEDLLKRIKLPGAENLHFVYLLQKSKYIEAVSYMDELSKGKSMRYGTDTDNNAIDTPNLVISAFNTTMAPVTQTLTDVYFRIRNKIKQKETQNRSPVPLSCQLIKQNANNLLGGIYHSSALSAHFATFYYDDDLQYGRRKNNNSRSTEFSPLSANNAPFLRKPQTETCREAIDMLNHQTLSYPQEYKPTDKRRIAEVQNEDAVDAVKGENSQQQKPLQANKKRRLHNEDFLAGFKHFQQKNIFLNDTGLSLTSEANESFLTQSPITKQPNQNVNEDDKLNRAPVKSLVSNELHSILKANTPEPSELRTRRGETPAVEEKTLRFRLPSTEETPKNVTDVSDLQEEAEEISEPQVKHRVVTRSISEESHEKNVDMTQYYSTLSTQDQAQSTSGTSVSIKDSGISITAKPLDTQESSVSLYHSARCKSLSPNVTGPKARKPLLRLSAEPEQLALESKYLSLKNTASYAKETSSDLGVSINKKTNNEVPITFKPTVPALLKITSVTTLSSAEFIPQICSSKVGDTQTKLSTEPLKMSERSTIVMTSASDCDMDLQPSIQPESETIFIQPRPPLASIEEKQNDSIEKVAGPSLDTTLGMSSYEITDFDTTAVGTVSDDMQSASRDLILNSSFETYNERCDEIYEEADEHPEEVIELLSSDENENDIDLSDNESEMEYETDEESLVSEKESENISEETANTDTNQESYNSSETDPVIEIDIVEELSTSDSNDIVLQQEDSDISYDGGSKESSLSIETTNSENSKAEFCTETTETKLTSKVETVSKLQKDQEVEKTTIASSAEEELNLLEEMPVKYPGSQIIEASIAQIANLNEDVNKSPEKMKVIPSPKPKTNEEEHSDLQSQNTEHVERIEEKLIDVVPKTQETTVNEIVNKPEDISEIKNDNSLPLSQDPEKDVMYSENALSEQQSFPQRVDDLMHNSEEIEKSNLEMSPNVSLEQTKEVENIKTTTKDLDTSEHFETPNASFNTVNDIDKSTPNIDTSGATESLNTDRTEELKTTQSTEKARRRGQSLPPQSLFVNEENIETDSQTPRTRSKRGISVPPQTVDSFALTPTGRQKTTSRNVLLSGRRKTANEEGESPQSPNSSRSGRGSKQRRTLWESGETPQLDSPALRTRSRMRTISENSDATAASLNSPVVSAKKTRRTSISSTISEQLQHSGTPKRSRRNSISGQSDTEGTPRTRRLLIKEVEDEAQKVEMPSTETGIEIYSSTRRLTRTQRALLEKSEQITSARDNTKDDQASVSSRISQSSTRSKRRTSRSASVKSNDDDDDRESVTSSVLSETRRSSRRLRAQQQHSPNVNLSSIPEDETVGGAEPPPKRNTSVKK